MSRPKPKATKAVLIPESEFTTVGGKEFAMVDGKPLEVVRVDASKVDMKKWEEGGRKLDRHLREMGLKGLTRSGKAVT